METDILGAHQIGMKSIRITRRAIKTATRVQCPARRGCFRPQRNSSAFIRKVQRTFCMNNPF